MGGRARVRALMLKKQILKKKHIAYTLSSV